MLTETQLLHMLEKPTGPIDAVLDTDTFNEIDDQYALAFLLKCREKIHTQAIYAAPFLNRKAATPAIGMELSYSEIQRIIRLTGADMPEQCVFRGSERFLKDEHTAVDSAAARDLVARAGSYDAEHPLYVIAIAAITNIASALLMDPSLAEKIVVVWLGGNALHWPDNREFNLYQDVAAARVVFDSGVPLVLLPCKGVVSAFTVSGPELKTHLAGKNPLCDYLVQVTEKEALACGAEKVWTRPIWDVTAVAWLLDEAYMRDYLIHRPVPEYDDRWAGDERRPWMRYVYHIERDKLFGRLFRTLTEEASK